MRSDFTVGVSGDGSPLEGGRRAWAVPNGTLGLFVARPLRFARGRGLRLRFGRATP